MVHYHGLARGNWQFSRGEFRDGAETIRAAQDAVDRIGARYYTHLGTFSLFACAVNAGDVRRRDLNMLRRGLLDHRDDGQQIQQWLLIGAAALAFAHLDRTEAAAEALAGLASSPWATGGVFPQVVAHIPEEVRQQVRPGSAPPLDLLVDDIIETLADLIDS